mgnify:CR=1 FL=1
MPFVVDGNNLIFALSEVGVEVDRGGLFRLLSRFIRSRKNLTRKTTSRKVMCLVFDGPAPYGPLAKQFEDDYIDVKFAPASTADKIILEYISTDSAPRLLTVVSTDHEIRTAAKRRRCKSKSSEEFARILLRMLQKPPRHTPAEPPEKRIGLTPEQARAWLKDLNIPEEDKDENDSENEEDWEEELL